MTTNDLTQINVLRELRWHATLAKAALEVGDPLRVAAIERYNAFLDSFPIKRTHGPSTKGKPVAVRLQPSRAAISEASPRTATTMHDDGVLTPPPTA